jgi:hypothetical protein
MCSNCYNGGGGGAAFFFFFDFVRNEIREVNPPRLLKLGKFSHATTTGKLPRCGCSRSEETLSFSANAVRPPRCLTVAISAANLGNY